jgi:multiple sugar transport system substrate-binding protein
MSWLLQVFFAGALAIAPVGAQGADLAVWWDQGVYPEQDAVVAELISAFEQNTGKDVELVQYPFWEMEDEARAAIAAGYSPDFIFGVSVDMSVMPWAYEDRLVELTDTLGSLRNLFDADLLATSTLLNGRTGRRGLYALPMGRVSNYSHAWTSLLERAGFTLADIPTEWEEFWPFWCDQLQPAVHQAMGRDDIWGVGLSMGAGDSDARNAFDQFMHAYGTYWADRQGKLTIDDPDVRAAGEGARELYRHLPEGLHPARFGRLERPRQQHGVPGAAGGDDAETCS